MLKSRLEVCESFLLLGGIRCQHHSHVVIWEERLRFHIDGLLVAFLCISERSISFLDNSKVVADSHIVAERALDRGQRGHGIITEIALLKSHSVVSACLFVGGGLDEKALGVGFAHLHRLLVEGTCIRSLSLLVTQETHVVVAFGKLGAVQLAFGALVVLCDTLLKGLKS